MKPVFNCTVVFYNTPVFFKVTQLDDNEYLAEPVDNELQAFRFKKKYGEWYAEGQTTHALAIQIGNLIDRSNTDVNE